MARARDLSFEALAEVTSTDWTVGRGKLNEALSGIRVQMPDVEDAELATEIVYRAKLYRRLMPNALLTPLALNQHWKRVLEENERAQAQATNQSTPASDCATCGGIRFVVYALREMPVTDHMKRLKKLGSKEPPHGSEFPSPTGEKGGFPGLDQIEEYARCPDCNEGEIVFRRYDGRLMRSPDPASVRARM